MFSKKWIVSILAVVMLISLIGCSTAQPQQSKEKRGNSTGNIANGAIAAEENGWIYYTLEEGIYKTQAKDNLKTELVYSDLAEQINVLDGWIYYSNGGEQGGLYKIRTDGTERTKICDDMPSSLNVVDDWMYYIIWENLDEVLEAYKAGNEIAAIWSVFKIKTDGTNRQKIQIDNFEHLNGIIVTEGYIYYVERRESSDGFSSWLNKISIDGTNRKEIDEVSTNGTYFPAVIEGNWIYYSYDRELHRIRTDGTDKERRDGVIPSTFNVSGEWIYYDSVHPMDSGGLYKVKVDDKGSQNQKICDYGDSWSVPNNVVGDWIYYGVFETEEGEVPTKTYYRIRTDGTDRQLVK